MLQKLLYTAFKVYNTDWVNSQLTDWVDKWNSSLSLSFCYHFTYFQKQWFSLDAFVFPTGDLKTDAVRDQIHCNPTKINRICFVITVFRTDFFSTLLCMKVLEDTLCINTGLPYATSTTMVKQVVAVYGCSMAKPRQLDVGVWAIYGDPLGPSVKSITFWTRGLQEVFLLEWRR